MYIGVGGAVLVVAVATVAMTLRIIKRGDQKHEDSFVLTPGTIKMESSYGAVPQNEQCDAIDQYIDQVVQARSKVWALENDGCS